MRTLVLTLLVACTPAQRTAALALSSSTLIVADWHQTHDITRDCREANPILGECGERLSVDVYFATALVAHLGVGLLLPRDWRDVWFGAVAGAQLATVWSNWRTP